MQSAARILKMIATFLGGVTAVCGTLYAIVVNFQTDVSLDYSGRSGDLHEFSFHAMGKSPVELHTPQIGGGGIIAEATRSVYLDEFEKAKDATLRSPYMSGAIDGLTMFPDEKHKFSFGFKSDADFLKVAAFTAHFSYRYRYENAALTYLFDAADFVGAGRKMQREACFFVCGDSVAKVSCRFVSGDIGNMYKTYCRGDFAGDRACCH